MMNKLINYSKGINMGYMYLLFHCVQGNRSYFLQRLYLLTIIYVLTLKPAYKSENNLVI